MKQKIVMKVSMDCQKFRQKALKLAAATNGVDSVAIVGAEKDNVVVIGDCIDPVRLIRSLRKKVGQADIISVVRVC